MFTGLTVNNIQMNRPGYLGTDKPLPAAHVLQGKHNCFLVCRPFPKNLNIIENCFHLHSSIKKKTFIKYKLRSNEIPQIRISENQKTVEKSA